MPTVDSHDFLPTFDCSHQHVMEVAPTAHHRTSPLGSGGCSSSSSKGGTDVIRQRRLRYSRSLLSTVYTLTALTSFPLAPTSVRHRLGRLWGYRGAWEGNSHSEHVMITALMLQTCTQAVDCCSHNVQARSFRLLFPIKSLMETRPTAGRWTDAGDAASCASIRVVL